MNQLSKMIRVDVKIPLQLCELSIFGWMKRLSGWSVFLFIMGTLCLSGKGQTQVLGMLMCASFVVSAVMSKEFTWSGFFRAPPELVCFSAWVFWAVTTGLFIVVNMDYYWADARKVLQILVMGWIVYGIVRLHNETLMAVPVGIICASLIIAGRLIFGSDIGALSAQTEQADGGTGNANALGIGMVFAVYCFPFLWGYAGRLRWLVFIAALISIPLFGYAILASGSRKSLLALALVIVSWLALGSSSVSRGMVWVRAGLVVLAAVIFMQILPTILGNTLVGQRLEDFMNHGDGSLESAAKENIRYQMYVQGIAMFLKNPVFGVGMGGFKGNFSSGYHEGLYSHSDYIEPLATTGLLGFILYQAVYFVLLFRVIKLFKTPRSGIEIYRLKMIVVLVITILFLGIGVPFYDDMTIRALLVAISVYTFSLGMGKKLLISHNVSKHGLWHRNSVAFKKIENRKLYAL